MSRKVRAASLSVLSNTLLIAGKLGVGLAIGSVSVISDAINSALDLVASVISLFSVRVASQPADTNHSYGHGKAEHVAALIEGLLVIAAGGWVVWEAVEALRTGASPQHVSAGLWVMAASAAVSWTVSAHLLRVAREEESAALEADGIQMRADVWTSLAVFAGLGLSRLTGLTWLDPVVAILVAAMILRAGWRLCMGALLPLTDARLPAGEEAEIVDLIEQHSADFVEFHDLRTRRAGSERHVDFHLVVHGNRSLEEVHSLCDRIESAILDRFAQAQVLIHPEPCAAGCDFCQGGRERRRPVVAGVAPRRLRARISVLRRQPGFAD